MIDVFIIVLGTLLNAVFIFGGFWQSQGVYKEGDNYCSEKCDKAEIPKTFWNKAIHDPIALFTLGILFFNGLLVYVTFRLVHSTNQLWESGERTFEASQRAFVYIDGFNYELTTAADAKVVDIDSLEERYKKCPELCIARFAVQPRLRNSGNTPTRNMIVKLGWRGPFGDIPPDYTKIICENKLFIGPQAIEPVGNMVEIPPARGIVDWEMKPCLGAEPIIFFWGRADYEDMFGTPHFVEWCHTLRFERHKASKEMSASFIQWGEHNRTDEDNPA